MSQLIFKEIKIFEDGVENLDIMKTIIGIQNKEDAFYILDIADVIKKHKDWIQKMPRVMPYYAIKCNPNPMVIKVLAALNARFDCASEEEIKQVMQYGVSGERIIFANPAKNPSHIKFAKKVNVNKMTVDSEVELMKIKDLFPEAKIIIRIRCDSENSPVILGSKFGCDPDEEAIKLIQITKDLNLTLYGFSFHVGSPCGDLYAYHHGIEICKHLVAVAKSMGCSDVKLIDIGGGFPAEHGTEIDKFSSIINNALENVDPALNIISEPGRYYVTSAFTLAAYLHTKKIITKGEQKIRMYYISCGTYGSFVEELLHLRARKPTTLFNPVNDEKFLSTLWGPTCDSFDCILKNTLLPEFYIGDWLIWKNMGAYSISLATTFNGIKPPTIYPIIRKSQWEMFCHDIKLSQKYIEVTENGNCN